MHEDGLLPVEAAWDAIRSSLRRSCGERIFDGWLKQLQLGECDLDAGEVRLEAPSAFMATWIQNHFAEQISAAWRAMLPQVRHIAIEAAMDAPGRVAVDAPAPEPTPEPQDDAAPAEAEHQPGSVLASRFSFDNFVVGKANELAYNAARTLAEGGKLAFNPLFLHGGVGLGKTHLMHAIGKEYRARFPNAKVVYMSAEKFMFEFVAALRAKDVHSFKLRLRSADVLMIDDVQFIAGKDSTQDEFFHTMNELISAGRRLVISADRSPQNLDGIESRIQSRLSWGLVADLNPADFELRYNIILKKLEAMPAGTMSNEVAMFLAKRISASVRELEGALNRVVALANVSNSQIDVAFAENALAEQLRASQRRVTIDEIQRRVCEHYRIRQAEMGSARRAREVARPRQIAMYLAKQLTQRSLPEIGRRFGGRDHTTVIHAVRTIEALRVKDAEIDGDVRLLMRQLEG
ncbi:chromosomal replication initiator protein DnaA [uncultured Sphingomonas sp.]|uniref:chromosomal replication initiator protein DnaA n=1 Tax=uncultured Sphingomonas sp. TaxID=158754 RepID=UPI0025F19574|nr:chromosomal replication initiator protein DnaA [uncultured Sphingomonas sp.]